MVDRGGKCTGQLHQKNIQATKKKDKEIDQGCGNMNLQNHHPKLGLFLDPLSLLFEVNIKF
jgi:hypothetical protein